MDRRAQICHIAAVTRQNFRLRQLRRRAIFIGIAEDEFAGFDWRSGAGCWFNSSSFNFGGGEPIAVAEMFMHIFEWWYRLPGHRPEASFQRLPGLDPVEYPYRIFCDQLTQVGVLSEIFGTFLAI